MKADQLDFIAGLFEQYRLEYLERARKVAIAIARERGEVNVDDVRKRCPPPGEIDARVMGGIFRSPEWEHAGYVKSRRKESHYRVLSTFRLKPVDSFRDDG